MIDPPRPITTPTAATGNKMRHWQGDPAMLVAVGVVPCNFMGISVRQYSV